MFFIRDVYTREVNTKKQKVYMRKVDWWREGVVAAVGVYFYIVVSRIFTLEYDCEEYKMFRFLVLMFTLLADFHVLKLVLILILQVSTGRFVNYPLFLKFNNHILCRIFIHNNRWYSYFSNRFHFLTYISFQGSRSTLESLYQKTRLQVFLRKRLFFEIIILFILMFCRHIIYLIE